jgi:hypothetical protein
MEEQGKGNCFHVKEGEEGIEREISMRWSNERVGKTTRKKFME